MMLGYARCSTMEQAAPGKSTMREQERVIKGIAMTRGVTGFDLVMYADPGISGALPLNERPAGKQLLEAAKKGDVVCAAKLDRMFRSASDALVTAENMKKAGIDLILFDLGHEPVTSNGMSKFFFTMVGAFAELERSKIADRMAMGREGKKARGGHIGGDAPFGFRKVGTGRDARLEPDIEEQDVITMVARIRRQKKPYHVAQVLNDMGVRSRTGGEVQATQVVRWLKNRELLVSDQAGESVGQ
jgi:putative DNA-invertase from lambdoid prophage Rac